MDRIQQAYGGTADDDEDEEDEKTTVPEDEEQANGSRKRAAPDSTHQEEQQQPPDRRRGPRQQQQLPDAGALLDGPRRRQPASAATIATATALAAPPPPSLQPGPPPHDGNFPFLVYVPVPLKGELADALADIVATAAPSVPGFEPLVGSGGGGSAVPAKAAPPANDNNNNNNNAPPDVPLHISLTRAGTVRLRQTALLVAALGRHLSKKAKGAAPPTPLQPPANTSPPPPIALLGRPRAFLNDDRTRSFLVLTALDPNDDDGAAGPESARCCAPALLGAIARCDAALRELGLPPYYSDGQPHVSLASAPATSHAAMEAAAEALGRTLTKPLPLPFPPGALCQIGKRRHVVWGEAPD